MECGANVIVHGLTGGAGQLLNNKHGKIRGPLGGPHGVKPGRYPVYINGEKRFKWIKACNLSPAPDATGAVTDMELASRIGMTASGLARVMELASRLARADDDAATGAVTDTQASGLARVMELANQRGIHVVHPRVSEM